MNDVIVTFIVPSSESSTGLGSLVVILDRPPTPLIAVMPIIKVPVSVGIRSVS